LAVGCDVRIAVAASAAKTAPTTLGLAAPAFPFRKAEAHGGDSAADVWYYGYMAEGAEMIEAENRAESPVALIWKLPGNLPLAMLVRHHQLIKT
jgi:hypothetical protein